MMKTTAIAMSLRGLTLAAGLLAVSLCTMVQAVEPPREMDFDHNGKALFDSYNQIPETTMAADSGDRNLNSYYELRQYPGSPPRIPHSVEPSFSDDAPNCLGCHAKGGYSPVHGKYVPMTPHPEKEMCVQCHVPKPEKDQQFVTHNWQSVAPPRLGNSVMGGSPPTVPHSLQLRENCIACHTGAGAVVEIRVEHSSRGNCRQCHVVALTTAPKASFTRPAR